MDSERAEYLVEQYADLLVRIGRTWLGDWDDAQDVCQAVLIKLLEDPRDFPDQGQERAWVVRLGVNQCKNWRKTAWFRRRAPLEEGLALSVEAPEPEDGSLLERVKLTRDSKRALVRALAAREMGAEKTGKRPSRRGRVVLTAAVLLLGALVLTAAALPGFWSLLGVHFSVNESEDGQTILYSYIDGVAECPVEVAEGRVWFVLDGQRIDITGQFNDEHAYVYETTNPETGLPNYILVGWSAGGIGYGEIVILPGDGGGGALAAHTRGTVRVDPAYPVFDHTYAPDPDANGWFENAVEELCAPYLGKIRPAEGTDEAQPPRTGPDSSARPTAQGPGLSG